jgi:hypothetical protein
MWNRNRFVNNLRKRLNLCGVKLLEIYPQYSSFVGNLINRQYPDPIASSIEMNRRCYSFAHHIKPILFPDFEKSINVIKQSLEELLVDKKLIDSLTSWKEVEDGRKEVK